VGERVILSGRTIAPVPANHVVPAVGYALDSGSASLVFTGDTCGSDAFWQVVNNIANLRYLIIETSFPDAERELAVQARHLCPSLLVEQLAKLTQSAEVFITHLKPGEGGRIMREIAVSASNWNPKMLQHRQVFDF
jgi:ribonuclease BN (tRNA processing enzyme)